MGDAPKDETLVVVTCRFPRWLKDDVERVATARLSDTSAMIREAVLAWLKCQKDAAA